MEAPHPPQNQGSGEQEQSGDSHDIHSSEKQVSQDGHEESHEDTEPSYSVEALETAIARGAKALELVQKVFHKYYTSAGDDYGWKNNIAKVLSKTAKTKFVIGVIGTTGAGKSSLINALVDEERLVPTNCLRACTAVATEISYHDGESKYKARIEFIKRAEWKKELGILFQDLTDSSGDVIRDNLPRDSEAAMSLDKIRAVYPSLTKEEILASSVEKLLNDPKLADAFGTTLVFEEEDAKKFYQRLKSYVDSKEKRRARKKDAQKDEPEWWPLIRVVKIYVKADALSTGAVIVDLPGVQDSNSARVAVAEEYMKKCSAHWVVAPITRAVDDAIAKKLLGQNMRRQLVMDSAMESITFICTKTDDVSTTEAQESLNLQLTSLLEEYEGKAAARGSLKDEIRQLQVIEESLASELGLTYEKLVTWSELLEACRDGREAYAPMEFSSPLKRKRERGDTPDAKRPEIDDSDDELAMSEDGEVTETDNAEPAPENLLPLTEADVTSKLHDLSHRRTELLSRKETLNDQITEKQRALKDTAISEENIQGLINIKCIRARNLYSKETIRRDFASGLKELDDEYMEELDPDNFDPEIETRNYGKLARNLPVFCVSSRGYQKVSGRLRRDSLIPGFSDPAETEIPQLQKHCRLLADTARKSSCINSLRSISQMFHSLTLWGLQRQSADVSEKKRIELETKFEDNCLALRKSLETLIGELFNEQHDTFEKHIIQRLGRAASCGRSKAKAVVQGWNTPYSRQDQQMSYRWNTYKAICRRSGVLKNAHGEHDWNQQLCDPMVNDLLPSWQSAFQSKLPEQLRRAAERCGDIFKIFHSSLIDDDKAIDTHTRIILDRQSTNHAKSLSTLFLSKERSFKELQRNVSREFTPAVTEVMQPAYEECNAQSGTGALKRMRTIMERNIETSRDRIFDHTVEKAVDSFLEDLKHIQVVIKNEIEIHLDDIRRDYYAAIVAPQLASFDQMQRNIKDEVTAIVKQVQDELELDKILFQLPASLHTGEFSDGDDIDPRSTMDVLDDCTKFEDEVSVKTEDAAEG
ncbi:hypothetical protein NFIA_000950 [Paecilomyces variotii No. 5]|uniref:Tat pathway signal sequence n=1 Tax=Byssochlamys spectabilis (strain No. 5 / NBRC 109023) TaxID=1356009 RepID=V5FSI8_BYSSN|nr:hypothetical protein NFIA_000950 [Paecilomyces variotii No. 5]